MVRKLSRRIGPETMSDLTRAMIGKAAREKRFRPQALRIDPTVVEADLKYPGRRRYGLGRVSGLARDGRRLAKPVGEKNV